VAGTSPDRGYPHRHQTSNAVEVGFILAEKLIIASYDNIP
jgi:hypothetical protein